MARRRKSEILQCAYFKWRIKPRAASGVFQADGRSNKVDVGRHSLGTTDYNNALDALKQLDAVMAVRHGLAERSILEDGGQNLLDLETGRELYLSHVQRPAVLGGARPSSVKRYRAVLAKFETWANREGVRYWNSVTLQVLQDYGAWLDDEGYAYATEYLELTTVKQVFNYLIQAKEIPAQANFELKLTKPSDTTTYCYRDTEVEAMIRHCFATPSLHWLGGVIVALAYSGLRISELASLRWTNIDLESGMLRLPDQTRAGTRAQRQAAQSTKGGYSRTLPLQDRFRAVLKGMDRAADGRVFHGPLGGVLKPDTVRNVLVREVIKPLAPRFPTPPGEPGFARGRLHSFRHFFCSRCAHSGVPEQTLMRWLGHRSSKMVQHYFHLHDKDSVAQMRKLDCADNPAPACEPDAGKDVVGGVHPKASSSQDGPEGCDRRVG